MPTPDPDAFRAALAGLPTGVTIVSAGGPDGPAGATANAVSSLSIEPMLMLACLDRGSRTLLAVQAADRFGISVLHAGQEPIARAFATKAPVAEKWSGVAWSERDGIPAIDDALIWIACDLRDVISAGDHVIVTGEVSGAGGRRGRPARLPRRRVPAAGAMTSDWTFAQKGLVILCALQLLWALAGFVAEPSFQIGSDAPTEKVLWVDFNGIHALSGLLLFGPAFYFARRPDWALYYTLYIVVALYATGLWALFDEQPGWVFTFPDNANDGDLPPRHRHPLPRRGGDPAASGPDARRLGLTGRASSQPAAIASAADLVHAMEASTARDAGTEPTWCR